MKLHDSHKILDNGIIVEEQGMLSLVEGLTLDPVTAPLAQSINLLTVAQQMGLFVFDFYGDD